MNLNEIEVLYILSILHCIRHISNRAYITVISYDIDLRI